MTIRCFFSNLVVASNIYQLSAKAAIFVSGGTDREGIVSRNRIDNALDLVKVAINVLECLSIVQFGLLQEFVRLEDEGASSGQAGGGVRLEVNKSFMLQAGARGGAASMAQLAPLGTGLHYTGLEVWQMRCALMPKTIATAGKWKPWNFFPQLLLIAAGR